MHNRTARHATLVGLERDIVLEALDLVLGGHDGGGSCRRDADLPRSDEHEAPPPPVEAPDAGEPPPEPYFEDGGDLDEAWGDPTEEPDAELEVHFDPDADVVYEDGAAVEAAPPGEDDDYGPEADLPPPDDHVAPPDEARSEDAEQGDYSATIHAAIEDALAGGVDGLHAHATALEGNYATPGSTYEDGSDSTWSLGDEDVGAEYQDTSLSGP